MSNQLTKYDAADFIDSDIDAVEHIKAAFSDGDSRIIRMAINDVARAYGMGKIANGANVGRQSLYKSLSEEGNPSFETMLKVLDAMGLQITVKVADRAA